MTKDKPTNKLENKKDETLHQDPDQRNWYYDGHGVKRPRTQPDIREEDS